MPMKLAYLLCMAVLLAAPRAAGQDEGQFARWIAKLRDADPGQQEIGRRILLARGTPALAELRRAAAADGDADVKARLLAVVREIERREPHGLFFFAGMPKMHLTLDLVNGDAFRYAVTVRNRSDKTVVLWPYLRLRVLDDRGKEVGPASRLGRFGLRRTGNLLEGIKFVTLEPGKAWSLKESLARYMHDPAWIVGWKLPRPGTYTLEFTYAFDRDAVKAKCDPGWKLLNDPAQPWNKALAFEHTFRTEMRVTR
jgi:hypothetical protein